MEAELDYPSSDSGDEDYVPSGGETLSDEEESAVASHFSIRPYVIVSAAADILDDEDSEKEIDSATKSKSKKGKKHKTNGIKRRKKKGGICLEPVEGDEQKSCQDETANDDYNRTLKEEIEKEKREKKEQEEKSKSDALWTDFMKDVGRRPNPNPVPVGSGLGALVPATSGKVGSSEKTSATSTPQKIKITKEYDFAGEVIKVTKEVNANSKEAMMNMSKDEGPSNLKTTNSTTINPGLKRPGGGLGSILGKINKKPKIGTLDKSKLDWEAFKESEGIQEELTTHNRGKDGYVERMNFLERTDHRLFEIEKSMRTGKR